MKNMIIAHNGSVQNIPNIPDDVKAIYKTVWEISQKKVIDLAADRGAFHLPESELEHSSAGADDGPTDKHAFLRMEEGLEDRHVLPENETCRSSNPVHN